MDDGKIIIKAQIDSSGVDQDTRVLEGKVTKSANNLSGIIKGIGFTALAAKATQVAIKFAKEVNEATEAVSSKLKAASTLYQGVAVDQEKLLKNLSSISTETGASLESLGQSVYDALSAGVKPTEDMADVLKVVEASAKLAKGGFTDTATALSSTMKVINAYSMGIDNLDKVQGILIQTQNSGITTVDELGASLAQVVPTAASFGVSFENVGAAIAEMTKQGTKTAQATTSLNAIIAELGKNGTKASKSLEEAATAAGMTDTDFKSMLESGMNLSEILQLMSDYAEENGLSMVDLFSSIEAGKGSLQLTGKAGEDFNEIMVSMEESAGLVQKAFEKTVDPSEKLSAAWNSLLVTIGSNFKPVADGLRGTLADMILSLSGQRTEADKLAESTEVLKTASEELKKAQEDEKGAVDETTASLLAQVKANYSAALKNNAKEYDSFSKKMKNLKVDSAEMSAELERQRGEVTGLYEDYKELFGGEDERSWISNVINADTKSLTRQQKSIRKLVIELEQDIADLQSKQIATEEELRTETEKTEKTIESLATAVNSGLIEINDIALWSPEMASRVSEMTLKIKEQTKAQEELNKATEEGSGSSTPTGGKKPKTDKSADASSEVTLHNQLVMAMETTIGEYERLDIASKKTGKELYTQEEKLNDLMALYIDFAKSGLKPTDSAMEDLWELITKLNPKIGEQEKLQKDLDDEMKSLASKYEQLDSAGEKLGMTFYSNDEYVSDLTDTLNKFIEAGIDPSCDGIGELIKLIDKLNGKNVDEIKKKFLGFINDVFVKSALESGIKAFGDLFDAIGNKASELEKISDALVEIEGENGKLAIALKEQEAAEIEYQVEKERGDAKAIASAEAKLFAARKTVETLNKERDALKNEQKATESAAYEWKAWGKSALESLSSVLNSIGAELAAKAALAAVEWRWADAGIATAGSLAAILAAKIANTASQKFATGGIVKGNSYTGDNIPVRVNAGELILNMAQQETLARILEASVALAELSASGGNGGGITVNMDGATIYGLDEPAVGKAIYENIQNLRYEGVI